MLGSDRRYVKKKNKKKAEIEGEDVRFCCTVISM